MNNSTDMISHKAVTVYLNLHKQLRKWDRLAVKRLLTSEIRAKLRQPRLGWRGRGWNRVGTASERLGRVCRVVSGAADTCPCCQGYRCGVVSELSFTIELNCTEAFEIHATRSLSHATFCQFLVREWFLHYGTAWCLVTVWKLDRNLLHMEADTARSDWYHIWGSVALLGVPSPWFCNCPRSVDAQGDDAIGASAFIGCYNECNFCQALHIAHRNNIDIMALTTAPQETHRSRTISSNCAYDRRLAKKFRICVKLFLCTAGMHTYRYRVRHGYTLKFSNEPAWLLMTDNLPAKSLNISFELVEASSSWFYINSYQKFSAEVLLKVSTNGFCFHLTPNLC